MTGVRCRGSIPWVAPKRINQIPICRKADLLRCLAFVENIIENCTQVYHNYPTETDDYGYYYDNPMSFYDKWWEDENESII